MMNWLNKQHYLYTRGANSDEFNFKEGCLLTKYIRWSADSEDLPVDALNCVPCQVPDSDLEYMEKEIQFIRTICNNRWNSSHFTTSDSCMSVLVSFFSMRKKSSLRISMRISMKSCPRSWFLMMFLMRFLILIQWDSWWGSWFSMRFLPKTSLRSKFWNNFIEILNEKNNFFRKGYTPIALPLRPPAYSLLLYAIYSFTFASTKQA